VSGWRCTRFGRPAAKSASVRRFLPKESGPGNLKSVRSLPDVFVIGEGGGLSLGLMLTLTGFSTGIGPIIVRRFTLSPDWV